MADPGMLGAGKALESSLGVLEKLGLLDHIKQKLINDPDKAAMKLDLVFKELRLSYETLDDALTEFSAMSFDKDSLKDAREFLAKARGGSLAVKMHEAHGHCSKIWYIYDRYLCSWFNRVLKGQPERLELEQLFVTMGNSDYDWVRMLDSAAAMLQDATDKLLAHVDAKDLKAAEKLRRDLLAQFRSVQPRISAGLANLFRIQQEFREITGGVNL